MTCADTEAEHRTVPMIATVMQKLDMAKK